MTRIYKLLGDDEWKAALASGRFEGSAVDLADGFIHFSTGDQLAETARRHFAGRRDLVCLAVEADSLASLRWEPSRGDALFPHLYGPLDCGAVIDGRSVPVGSDGNPEIEPRRL